MKTQRLDDAFGLAMLSGFLAGFALGLLTARAAWWIVLLG